jgi:hypothetical protein
MWKNHASQLNPIMKSLLPLAAFLALTSSAFASFHLMQVEQIIAAMEGNTSAQAIQLRMRAPDQDLVSLTRVRAWDAAGANPVLILDITTNVPGSPAGARILLCTPAFTSAIQAITPAFAPDFQMTNPIPASYLKAGKLTFESDSGTILWSVAWGGAAYTGSNTGSTTNDVDGDFGPAFAQGLPTTDRRGLLFKGAASALSTSNATNYGLSPIPAKVFNNSGTGFFIGSKQEISIEQPAGSALVDNTAKRSFGTVAVGQAGAPRTFTIKNPGTANLTRLNITIDGLNPADFVVTPLTETTLAPGNSTTFKVTFKPSSLGFRNASIHIPSNDANENPFDIKLTGSGGAP